MSKTNTKTSETLITSTRDTWIRKICIPALNEKGEQDPSGFYAFLTYTTGNIDASVCYTLANKNSVCAATESESSISLEVMNVAITTKIREQTAQCSKILEGKTGIVSLFNKAVKTSEQTTEDSSNTQHNFAHVVRSVMHQSV